MTTDEKTFSERWDEAAEMTMTQVYRRAGVQPGDHFGYLKARGFFDRSPLMGAAVSVGLEDKCPPSPST